MVKCSFSVCFIAAVNIFMTITALPKERCERCMPIEKCAIFRDKTQTELKKIREEFSCEGSEAPADGVFGFSTVAKGDYICCPDLNVWGIEGPTGPETVENNQRRQDEQGNNQNLNYNNNQDNFPQRIGSNEQSSNLDVDDNNDYDSESDNYEHSRIPYQHRRPINRRPYNNRNTKRPSPPKNSQQLNYPNYNGPYNNNPSYSRPVGSVNNFDRPKNNIPNLNGNNPNLNGNTPNFNGNNPNLNGNTPNFNGNTPNFNGNTPNFNGNNPNLYGNNPNFNGNNPNFNRNSPNFNGFNGNNANSYNNPVRNDNAFGRGNLNGQCVLSNYPPTPETGCCGRDVSFASSIMGPFGNRPANSNRNFWTPPEERRAPSLWSQNTPRRYKRSAENEAVNITLDNRIAGGKETELEQFPWTVLIKTTFDYGDKKAAFNCGGSLISGRYVLTAAHCVVDEGARVSEIVLYLAEYDKRTFPQDCVNVRGEGRKCIENIVMNAEDFIPHPQYDDKKLQNDIALIKLRGNAPYTDFIRPICFPSIDIDNPDYSNLRLAVAGWGRNGRFTSQVKQSTVVNLVPQRECAKSYPHLTRRHLCAAGHSGEDTCKGDSGGPLMMLYEGKYHVSGVVSGKRADSPCGTSVPSLYTNVYHYLDWIRRNIN